VSDIRITLLLPLETVPIGAAATAQWRMSADLIHQENALHDDVKIEMLVTRPRR
jgi:hypothetical protein